MKPLRRKRLSKRLGSALVMTLVIIVLITVVTVGYLASVMLETKTAGAGLDQERAYGIAMIGVHEAMSRVRDALGPWDDPYKNFAHECAAFLLVAFAGAHHALVRIRVSVPTNFALFSEVRRNEPRKSQPAPGRRELSDYRATNVGKRSARTSPSSG